MESSAAENHHREVAAIPAAAILAVPCRGEHHRVAALAANSLPVQLVEEQENAMPVALIPAMPHAAAQSHVRVVAARCPVNIVAVQAK